MALSSIRCLSLGIALTALGCSPNPSRVPLGEGPLAVAEAERRTAVREQARGARFERAKAAAKPNPSKASVATAATPSTPARSGHETEAGPSTLATAESPDAGAEAAASGGPGSVAAFVGDYEGEDTSVYSLEGMPDRTDVDPNARTRVDEEDANHVGVVLVDSSNGSDICTLRAEVKGTRAVVEAGQRCFEQSTASVRVRAAVTRGTATLKDDRLTLDMNLDVEMTLGDRTARGTLSYHFTGTRR